MVVNDVVAFVIEWFKYLFVKSSLCMCPLQNAIVESKTALDSIDLMSKSLLYNYLYNINHPVSVTFLLLNAIYIIYIVVTTKKH